jgi:acyl dehydratase
MGTFEVIACNWATASENKIHDDTVARQFGFRGGLVPGVTLYAYIARTILDAHGIAWLSGGQASVRFLQPAYEGESVVATHNEEEGHDMPLAVIGLNGPDGAFSVAGTCHPPSDTIPPEEVDVDVAMFASRSLPAERPPADEVTLAAETALGSLHKVFEPAEQQAYLDAIGLDDPHCTPLGVAHPGWLLLDANAILVANVRMGPWIHVGSEVRSIAPVRAGQHVEVRANVIDRYERKGHRFVVLDVLTLADDAPAHRVRHTAIYQPRQVG